MLYIPHMAWAVVYYETAQGDTLIEAFLDALSHGARAKCLVYISRLEVMGRVFPLRLRHTSEGRSGSYVRNGRGWSLGFFYAALVGKRFILLHAIQKKRQKLRERDIVIAEQRYEEIKGRSHDENA
jgi:phage-related protein